MSTNSMDLFSSPSWDADDACEDLNMKLFGSMHYSVSASNKKSRDSERKIAKAERKQSSNKVSPRSQTIAKAKQEVLSELKGRFAKKRKLDDIIDHPMGGSLSDVPDKKSVRFKVDADDNLLVDVKVMSAKKISKKNKIKLVGKNNEVDTVSKKNGTDLVQSNKYAVGLLFSKITKKKAKLDKKAKTVVLENDNIKIKQNGKKKKGTGMCVADNASFQAHSDEHVINAKEKPDKIPCNEIKPCIDSLRASNIQQTKSKHIFFSAEGDVSLPVRENGNLSSKTTADIPAKQNVSHTTVTQVKNNGPKVNRQQSSKSVGQKLNLTETKTLTRRNPGTLRERMMRKLQASRFRYLNEQMYCSKGSEALEYFQTDPEAFQAYHQGYRSQVAQWPLNPIDKIIIALKKKPPTLVVADFGCGDAKLARSLPNKVHSFDLVSVSPEVTACDMAHTPLGKASVDVAVFCLSLMGTNLADYLKEANRVLKPGGILKIAEVESRFENVDAFIKSLHNYGFHVTNKDLSNNLFYFIDLKKADNIKKKKSTKLPDVSLKPCLYKKR